MENKFVDEEKNSINAQADMENRKPLGDFNGNSKRVLIVVPEDADVSEIVQMADIIQRANISFIIASLDDANCVRCSNNVLCYADTGFSNVLKEPLFDVIVLPGGLLGAKWLGESKAVGDLLKKYETNHRWIVAIGDALPVLRKHFIGKGKILTCHPLIKHKIEGSEYMKYKYVDDNVFVDGKIITCRGGPHTTQCALNLVHVLCGRKIAETIAEKLLINYDDGYCRDCCGNCKYCCREDKKEIEPDITDRFVCSTCCSTNDADVIDWERQKLMAEIFQTEEIINCKLKREELKDLENDRLIDREEMEKWIKEDSEELKKWKEKWQSDCCISETESERYKREYVEQEEMCYDVLMQRKYDRQRRRHERSKRRQDLIETLRNLQPDEIDAILAKFDREENL